MVRCGGRLYGREWMGLEGLIGRERNVLIVCGFGGKMYRKAVIYQRKGLHHRMFSKPVGNVRFMR